MSGPRGGLGYLLIGQPALSGMVARALATKGDQPQYLEGRYELGVTALNLTDFEYRYLRRSGTFQANAAQAAVAVQNQGVSLSIGAAGTARGVIAVVEAITICNENAAAQIFHYGVSNINPGSFTAGPFFGMAQDDRSLDAGGAIQSAGYVFPQSAVAALMTIQRAGRVSVPPGATVEIRGPWVVSGKLAVGGLVFTTMSIVAGAQNVIVSGGFRWYERDILASEL